MLDVKRLKVLREVARSGSFSAAADELGYTQPAVSQQISALEREAGTRLLQRGARGVTLTDAGRALVDHSDAILARLAAAEEELEAIAGLRGGRLRLASFPTAGATLVPLAIAMFSKRHPLVELSLTEAEPEDALPMLRSGDLDVALTFEYSSLPGSAYSSLHEDVDRVPQLADESWSQADCDGLCGKMHIAACEAAGFEPQVGFRSDDYNVVQGLVAAGVAISLIPELALSNVRDDIVIRSLGKRAPVRRVAAATLPADVRSPATDGMLEILVEAAREYDAHRRELAA